MNGMNGRPGSEPGPRSAASDIRTAWRWTMSGSIDSKAPLSPAQLAARQANSRRSTGPKDTSRSRFNGTKHGMRAETLVLPGEDPARYERRLAALIERHDPRDAA